jgi:hypothetical protein
MEPSYTLEEQLEHEAALALANEYMTVEGYIADPSRADLTFVQVQNLVEQEA